MIQNLFSSFIPDNVSLISSNLYFSFVSITVESGFPFWGKIGFSLLCAAPPHRIRAVPPYSHPMGEDQSSDDESGISSSSSQSPSEEDEGEGEGDSSEPEPIPDQEAHPAEGAPEHVLDPDREAMERALSAYLSQHHEDPGYGPWVMEQLRTNTAPLQNQAIWAFYEAERLALTKKDLSASIRSLLSEAGQGDHRSTEEVIISIIEDLMEWKRPDNLDPHASLKEEIEEARTLLSDLREKGLRSKMYKEVHRRLL